MKESATRIALFLLVVAGLAVAIDNFDRPLANPDEGRYSEISREMAEHGDWITPRLNGVKYLEKPPLQYWATAISLKLFGESEPPARLYTWLCAVAIIFLVGFTANRLGGADRALITMITLVSAPYFMALGGVVTLDMGLTLWTTVTFCGLVLAEHAGARPAEHRRWMLLAWAGMALAVLSKGLIGIVFPAAAIVLHVLLRRDFRILARLEWGYGLVLFFVIAAPWFVAVSLANDEFVHFFFVHEHFERFLTTEHRRVEAWWYFFPILLVGFLPWVFALPGAVSSAIEKEAGTAGIRPLTFSLLWSAFILLFFTASGSKLPAYILPAFPPLALVLGRYLAEAPTRRLAFMVFPIAIAAIAIAVFSWRAANVGRDEWTRQLYQAAQVYAYLSAASLFAGAVIGGWLLLRGRRMLALLVVAIGVVSTIDSIEDAYEEFSPRQSGMIVAEKMKPYLSPSTRIYSVMHYEQTVPFYIRRTVTLVNYLDEFEPGLRTEPAKAIARVERWSQEWQQPGEALAIMQPDLFEKLRAQGLPMQVLHQDPKRVLVRKP